MTPNTKTAIHLALTSSLAMGTSQAWAQTANTSLGVNALASITTGSFNSAFGQSALRLNTTANSNTAVGVSSLFNTTTGGENTAIGDLALFSNISGTQNTATGTLALSANSTGKLNTATGYLSLNNNTTGENNTAMGSMAMNLNNEGSGNAALGYSALSSNTTGMLNAAVGNNSLGSNTTGQFNTAFGAGALPANSIGTNNAAQGALALFSNTTGSQNLGIGAASGFSVTTGSNNVFLGYNAGAFATGSNQLYISSNSTTPLLYGVFSETAADNKLGIGTETVSAAQAINVWNGAHLTTGGVWTNASSRELKDDIRTLSTEDANAALEALSPVRYVYKNSRDEEYLGFIAEDVPELVATADHKSLSPMDIVAVLTTVTKEQRLKMQEKDTEMAALRDALAQQEAQNQALQAVQDERMLQLEMALAEVLRHQAGEARVSLAN